MLELKESLLFIQEMARYLLHIANISRKFVHTGPTD